MIFLDTLTFFGRLHPLLVHLPIGFLIIAVLISGKRDDRSINFNRFVSFIWFLSFISSAFTALMGWLLAQNGTWYGTVSDRKPIKSIIVIGLEIWLAL